MKLFDLSVVNQENAGVVSFGFFDCIHRGHRKVIEKAVSLAKQSGNPSSVFLFKNNIYPMLGINKIPLFSFEERVRLIDELGVDNLFYVEADQSFLSFSAEEFISYLKEKLIIAGFVCGEDFSFGAHGIGGPDDLYRGIGGISAIVELFEENGEKISSEAVKRALAEGDISLATCLLGRDVSVLRQVEEGRKDGRGIGYPTLNSSLGTFRLKPGVYFTMVTLEGGLYRALTNVGAHPTFGDYRENMETFVLDFDRDLYGKTVQLTFLKYHRGIISFSDVWALKAQIAADVTARREYD